MSNSRYWQSVWRRRLGRRALLRGATLSSLGLAAAAAIGCGEDEQAPPQQTPTATGTTAPGAQATTAPAGQPVKGGVLKQSGVPSPATYQQMDPHAHVWVSGFTWATTDQLVRRDMGSNQSPRPIVPDAALSWEQPDGLTYIFHLNPDIKFHNIPPANGRKATSEDVKYSIGRIGTDDPRFFRRNDFKTVEITTPDPQTVVFKTAEPLAAFWSRIVAPGTVILGPESIEAEGEAVIRSGKPIPGTGPFIQKQWELDRIHVLERNPDYWKKDASGVQLPYLDGIEGRYFADLDSTNLALRSGEIDYSAALINHERLVDLERAGLRIERTRGVGLFWLVPHLQKEPFTDARVRKALSLVVDRQEVVNIAYGGEEGAVLAPGGLHEVMHGAAAISDKEMVTLAGYRTGREKAQDREMAKELLSQAGLQPNQIKFTMLYSTFTRDLEHTMAQAIQDQFKQFGFDVTLEPQSYGDCLVRAANGDFEVWHTRQHANGWDPDDVMQLYFWSKATRNYAKWVNTQFDSLFDQETRAVDPEARAKLLREMVNIIYEENPRSALWVDLFPSAFQPWLNGMYGYFVTNTENDPSAVWLGKRG